MAGSSKISARVSTYHPYLSDFIDISVVVYVGGALIGCRFGGGVGVIDELEVGLCFEGRYVECGW